MTTHRRRALVWVAGAIMLGVAGLHVDTQAPRSQLLLVVDGLRPDDITPQVMPRLHALGQRGVFFNAHHSVFPAARGWRDLHASGIERLDEGRRGRNAFLQCRAVESSAVR